MQQLHTRVNPLLQTDKPPTSSLTPLPKKGSISREETTSGNAALLGGPTPRETNGKKTSAVIGAPIQGKRKVIAARRLVRHRKVDSVVQTQRGKGGVLCLCRVEIRRLRRSEDGRVATTGTDDGVSAGHLFLLRDVGGGDRFAMMYELKWCFAPAVRGNDFWVSIPCPLARRWKTSLLYGTCCEAVGFDESVLAPPSSCDGTRVYRVSPPLFIVCPFSSLGFFFSEKGLFLLRHEGRAIGH